MAISDRRSLLCHHRSRQRACLDLSQLESCRESRRQNASCTAPRALYKEDAAARKFYSQSSTPKSITLKKEPHSSIRRRRRSLAEMNGNLAALPVASVPLSRLNRLQRRGVEQPADAGAWISG